LLNCIFYAFWIYERKSGTLNTGEIDTCLLNVYFKQ
jgi:hypothetical protein